MLFVFNPIDSLVLTRMNESVYGLWETIAGGNGTLAAPGYGVGKYYIDQLPEYAFDQNSSTKYTSFGNCENSTTALSCGKNTGLYLTLQKGASLLSTIRFRTGDNYPKCDPLTITIEGSNNHMSTLLLGSSWTLIYSDSTGLDSDPGRQALGEKRVILNNTVWYTSYRILVTSKRGAQETVQYSEIELSGN
jgi:hypothetical protein